MTHDPGSAGNNNRQIAPSFFGHQTVFYNPQVNGDALNKINKIITQSYTLNYLS